MEGGFDSRIQIVAVAVTVVIFGLILELVRRRRLVERYALLWLVGAFSLLILAIWRGLLNVVSDLIGVAFPPNALFLLAFGVVFVLLLHFSVATSRLGEETKILAQEVARLDQEMRQFGGAGEQREAAEQVASVESAGPESPLSPSGQGRGSPEEGPAPSEELAPSTSRTIDQ